MPNGNQPPISVLSALTIAATLGIVPGKALGQDAVKVEVVRKGQVGSAPPSLIVLPQMDATNLFVKVECGGVKAERRGAAREGEKIQLELQVKPGTWDCKGTLEGQFVDGSEGQMPLRFQVTMMQGMEIVVPRDRLDLTTRKLAVILDRPAKLVETKVFGENNRQIGQGITPIEGVPPGQPAIVEWTQEPGEVFHIHLQVTDMDGLWTAIDLFPWHYEIPHEDIEFETAMHTIRPEEEPKLVAALQEAFTVLNKYQYVDVPMNLYVGGYTDSVGDKSYNQGLSQRRAQAIATWFRDHGFKEPIYYQGFGEEGQKVRTPDEVDEPRNRRAIYVLAAEPPAYSADFPGTNWKKLP